ncbi:MAG: hypothetical protein UW92_C0021G0024 [Candidatus Jorgensenbacteria bacterium GW2011_GWA2_45_13]|uniref:Uncharacterized protein n=1 Tax=Candidatus Jorgensenbacteria bacterium GW2011_GWA2_45_13 TaxID=1618662 RepID=A0A0G1L4T0_9BACT|nr:MAG: hypothetical protein UW92_C0021G0024 [Candidatus Jorgensenbacteria bacterium GW2011_GWA2_45_13]
MNNKGSVASIIIIFALVLVAAIGVVWYLKSPPALVGGDRDAHGCISSAGYSWCEVKQKCFRLWEEQCGPNELDYAFNTLNAVRATDQGVFGYASSSLLEWRTEGNVITKIRGFVVSATGVHRSDYDAVRSYFENNGFSVSNANAAGGPTGGLEGYKKDNLGCLLLYTSTDITLFPDQPVRVNSDLQDINVSCGLLNP